ncbi:MAG: hypothetical protein Q9188_006312, partial [Gyalolechia gomerana]
MLPETISTSYIRYKAYESPILHWIVSTSNAYSYGKSIAPNSSKKPKHGTSGSIGTPQLDDPDKPTKYIVPHHEIVDRVEFIIAAQKLKRSVPTYIIDYLKKSIADRERCTKWFRKHMVGDITVERSTAEHVHFTGVLKSVLKMLELHPSSTSLPQRATLPHSIHDLAEAGHRFSKLSVEDPMDVVEAPEVWDQSPVGRSEEIEPPSSDNKEIYEAESTDEDRLIAMYDLLEKLEKTRKGIRDIWTEYRKKSISLINATAVTNAAIELAHNREDQLRVDFPESPYWDELIEILFPDIAGHWQTEPSAWAEKDVEDLESVYYFVTHMLKDFQHTCNASDFCDWIKIWTPKVNRVYDHREDVSKLSAVQKLIRSKTLMDNVLPELCLQARHGIIYTRDKLTDAFKHMLDTRHVYLYVCFAFQILCDIHLVLGDQVFRPFDDLRVVGCRLIRHRDTIMKPLGDRSKVYEEIFQAHQKIMDQLDHWSLDDPMMRWRWLYYNGLPNHEYEIRGQKPHFLITHQTLLCGALAAETCLRMQEISMCLADKFYHVTAVLHLHNALKKEGCLSTPIPFLEALEQLYEPEKIFLGGAPTNPQAYRNHYLVILGFSLKYFAAGKPRKGCTKRKDDRTRPRDLTVLRPVMQALKNEFYRTPEQPGPPLSDLIKLVEERKKLPPRPRSSPMKPSPLQDLDADPISFLATLRDRISEEQAHLDASFYNAYFTSFRLLQQIAESQMVKKRFRKEYGFDDNDARGDAFVKKLYYVPLFLFERHLDDPEGMWFASVGETVEKFFRGWEMGEEDLRRG